MRFIEKRVERDGAPGGDRGKRMLTVREAVEHAGICKTNIHALIGRGAIVARKFGARTLIEAQSLDSYLDSLPLIKSRGTAP